jgi:hypothetical protein
MPIQTEQELYQFLEPFELPEDELRAVVSSARFESGRCMGLNYGPLKRSLTIAQFDRLLTQLNVWMRMPIGERPARVSNPANPARQIAEPDEVCPNAYPGADDCYYRDNHFCNISGYGKTAKDCPQPP